MKIKNLIPLLICISCASNQSVSFKSFPDGATVTQELSNGSKKVLGITPLNTNGSDVFGPSSDMTFILISKEDHVPQKLLLGPGSSDEKIEIVANLELSQQSGGNKEDVREKQEVLAQSMATVSTAISKKRYDEAEKLLSGLLSKYPHLSVPYDLLGNIHYLRGNMREALVSYKKAATLNSNNPETLYMIKKLSDLIKE